MYIVDVNDRAGLTSYLRTMGWLRAGDEIEEVSKPGEGNMNCVLRIRSAGSSFILKQSRGYVEKYPQIAAPASRVLQEALFYETTRVDEVVAGYMPELIGIDPRNNIMALEDLGPTSDFTHLYAPHSTLPADDVRSLMRFLSGLHHRFYRAEPDVRFRNNEMRALNYQHIFIYPFLEENGFNLDTIHDGLQGVAMPLKKDTLLKEKILALGAVYLAHGHYLLHGDFYPGSWVKSPGGVKVIDPEFSFYGPFEFDLGVMMAHLLMARQDVSVLQAVSASYQPREAIHEKLLEPFIGIEIMRRLIGLAQLPLTLDLDQKKILLEHARDLIMKH